MTGSETMLPLAQMSAIKATIVFLSVLALFMVVNTEEIAWRGFVFKA